MTQGAFNITYEQAFGVGKSLAAGKRCPVIGHTDGEVHEMSHGGKRCGNMAGTRDEQYGRWQERLNKKLRPAIFRARYFFEVWLACGDGTTRLFSELWSKGRRSIGKEERTKCAAIFTNEHLLTYARTPQAAGTDDGNQYNGLLTFHGNIDGLSVILHSRLTWGWRVMPGLDKDIENAAAYALALHVNLF